RLVRVPLAGPGEPGLSGRPEPVEGRVITAGESQVVLEIDGERRELGYAELGPGRVQVEFGRPAAEPDGQGAAAAGAATGPQTGGRPNGYGRERRGEPGEREGHLDEPGRQGHGGRAAGRLPPLRRGGAGRAGRGRPRHRACDGLGGRDRRGRR